MRNICHPAFGSVTATLKKVLKEYILIIETNYSKLFYYFKTDKVELGEDIFREGFFIFKKK